MHVGVSNTKIYFYINKVINTNKWAPTHYLVDVCIIKLKGHKWTIQIYNIYNPQ